MRAWCVALMVAVTAMMIGVGSDADAVTDDMSLILDDQMFFVTDHLVMRYTIDGEITEVGPTTTTTSTTTTTTTLPLLDVADGGISSATTTPDETNPVATTSVVSTTTTSTSVDDDTGAAVSVDNEATVRIALHGPFDTRIGIASALSGSLGDPVDVTTQPLVDLGRYDETTGERQMIVDVPIRHRAGTRARDPIGIEVPANGLYAVDVAIFRGAERLTRHITAVDVADSRADTRSPFGASITAVIPTPDSFDDSAELVATRAALEAVAALDARVDAPISLFIHPAVAEFAAAGSPAAGVGVGLWAAGFDGEVYSMPSPDLDPSTAAVSGLSDEFAAYLVTGTQRLDAAFPRATVRRDVWAITEQSPVLTEAGADLLRDLGVRGIVLGWEDFNDRIEEVSVALDATTAARYARPDGLVVITADPATARLTPSTSSNDSSPALDRAVQMLADWSVRRLVTDDDRWALVTTPTLGVPDVDVASALVNLLNDDDVVRVTSTSYAVAATSPMLANGRDVVLTADVTPPADLSTRVEAVTQMRLRILDVASMLPDGDERPAAWSAVVDAALSSAVPDDVVNQSFDAIISELDELRRAVRVLDIGTVNLTGTDTPMPLRLQNSSDTPLRVVIDITSSRLVPVDPIEMVVEPGDLTVRVPVTPRANGRFPITVDVATPAGGPGGVGVVITAVSASLSGLGRGVGAGLIVILATWWLSHFRRRRRERLAQMRHATLTDDSGIDDTGGIDLDEIRSRRDVDDSSVDT